ncbi:hypothetical protein HMPREF9123_1175 [Neisseria bacilliformis ATCC BAA-1200]|uniref:Uncharacterized protein n=1 Tax=Neisseria bacilliformis ATCC BAA-1200 TaxID=888742 RepID=F2BBS0_9NEIS|nr:hypothetical protein HMPREF9123_1175 [Neisseria bacilliformis ATCC BAA-1200]
MTAFLIFQTAFSVSPFTFSDGLPPCPPLCAARMQHSVIPCKKIFAGRNTFADNPLS